jgi:hypothetical protein
MRTTRSSKPLFKQAQSFCRTVVPSVIKPLHVLWNEIIGFIFLVFACGTLPAGWRYYRRMDEDPTANGFRLAITIAFAATMAGLGISSFLKARKLKRQGLERVYR